MTFSLALLWQCGKGVRVITSCVARAETVVGRRVGCKRVAVMVIKIQSFKVKFTPF